MISLNAHYDGKVFIPDAPLNLPTNQRVRISVEPIEGSDTAGAPKRVDLSKLMGLGLKSPANPNPRFPDEDSLWEGSAGEDLINDPRKKKSISPQLGS